MLAFKHADGTDRLSSKAGLAGEDATECSPAMARIDSIELPIQKKEWNKDVLFRENFYRLSEG